MLSFRLSRRFSNSLLKTKALEKTFGCWNYEPLPVVLSRGQGVHVWDTDNNQYFDCLSAYGAVNQGHCHPGIKQALIDQMDKITLTSRAFFNDQLGVTCEYICKTLGYDRMIFANTGVEAGETALKFARKWGYTVKKIPEDKAEILFANQNFWGRSIAACGSSDDKSRYENFGPYNMGFTLIEYGNLQVLEDAFKSNPNIAAYMLEPIQGEAGIVIPHEGYLKGVRALCDKYNVLMIADEVQTGMGRTGKMLAVEWEDVKPDMVCLGKALSGGYFPVSGVVGSNEVFDCIKAGDHGSTYGGNPLACAVAKKSVEVLIEEGMVENSNKMGEKLKMELNRMLEGKSYVKEVRGRGLFTAIEVNEDSKVDAYTMCIDLLNEGVLCKPTHKTKIRFTPPLILSDTQMDQICSKIQTVINKY